MKRTTFPLILAVYLIPGLLLGQTRYADYPASARTTVFADNFDDNRNNWWTGRDEADESVVSNGYLEWMRLSAQGKTSFWTTPELVSSRDFEIETRMRILSSEENYLCGLIWGRSPEQTSDFVLGFSADGDYRICKRDNDAWSYYTEWEKQHVNPTGYNKLTVRKVGNWYYFFVNEQFVHQQRFEPFFGPRVGFVIHARAKVSIDYLQISYLNKPAVSGEPGYYDFSNSQKQDIFYDGFDDNRNAWWTGNDGTDEATIAQGYLQWERLLTSNATSFWNKVFVDEARNFEIETRFKIAKYSGGYLSGIIWGRSPEQSSDYVFGFNGNGSHRICKRTSDVWTYYTDWGSDAIIKDGFNKLTIRKVGNDYLYFINERFVHRERYEPMFGDRIGFVVNFGTKILVDYLRVSYLNGSGPGPQTVNQPPVISITEPDVQRGFNVVQVSSTRVAGQALDSDGISEVTVNGRVAFLQSDGSFSTEIALQTGQNTITVKAVDNRGLAANQTFTLSRQEAAPQVTERRLALIVGNSNYQFGGSLRNPTNDARDFAATLQQMGFTVMRYENLDQAGLKRAIDEFGARLKGHDVGLFFYAGHGVQVQGSNYLVPINAQLQNENDVEYDCVQADRVLAKMEAAGCSTNIVILDACRDNPFERSWSRSTQGQGLAFMNAPSGSIIAYATSPGNTASDGSGTNGLYTSALLQHIRTPGITIEDLFKRVRVSVMNQSGGRQTPWESTSLRGNFYFKQ
ncbi:MAG: hypothetical protein OHK0039_27500 [Bacteroidia bacterium]